jgi:glucose/arabinose dehydrogenase
MAVSRVACLVLIMVGPVSTAVAWAQDPPPLPPSQAAPPAPQNATPPAPSNATPPAPERLNARPPNAANQSPAFPGQTRAPEAKLGVLFDVVTVVEKLQNPWSVAFLPDGRMLITERPGRLRIAGADGTVSEPVAGLPPVDARAQGGLLDVALDPNFAENHRIYWSFSEPREDGTNNTAVGRGTLVDETPPRLDGVEVIYHQTPSLRSTLHFGSRLVFARDGTLLVTQGDRSITEGRMQAQRMDGLLGKIVRINDDGTVPEDNPFVGRDGERPEIWSLGHRNIQSATLHPVTGDLWEVEHGTRGGDEINIARKGKDYGWPTIAYGIEYRGGPITGDITASDGMEQPIYYWDPVIGPSGMAFYTGELFPAWKGSLFVGGHQTMDLVRLTLEGDAVVGEERLLNDLQPKPERVRDVRQGPDGALYVLTDGAAGRLIKLVPKAE